MNGYEKVAPSESNSREPLHMPEETGMATRYVTPSLMELPTTVPKPHYAVTREVLDHMDPIARLTAQLCLAHGTWELVG